MVEIIEVPVNEIDPIVDNPVIDPIIEPTPQPTVMPAPQMTMPNDIPRNCLMACVADSWFLSAFSAISVICDSKRDRLVFT